MKPSYQSARIGIAVAVILCTVGWLAYTGYSSNKSYYVTISELGGMGDKAYHSNLRVEGFVQPGSIVTKGTDVNFVLNEYESHSPKPPAAVSSMSLTREPSRRPTPSKTTRRLSPSAPMAATASSTPICFRPNAPANTLRLSPAQHRLRLPRRPAQNRTPPLFRHQSPAYAPAGSPQPAAN